MPGDWATVHWKAYLMDNRMVSDSRSEGQGLPKVFSIGKSDVFKCWDLAVPQLKAGAKAKLTCPAHYAWGNAYTQAPLGGEPIPLNSDVYFDLEVLECNRVPEDDNVEWTARGLQPQSTTMQRDVCMYLHHRESEEHESTPLVLNCDDQGCGLEEWVFDDKDQEFWYDSSTERLCSYNNGLSKAARCIDATAGNGLGLAAQGGLQWTFNDRENTLVAYKSSGQTLEMTTSQARKWSNVVLSPFAEYHAARSDKNAKWRIEYCQHEDKPNPETAPERIPQDLSVFKKNTFPKLWYEAGSVADATEEPGATDAHTKPYVRPTYPAPQSLEKNDGSMLYR